MYWKDNLVLLIQEHALWYIAPFYMIIGFYILLVLGWFFSTDYYDKIYNAWDTGDEDFGVVHFLCIFIIICIIGSVAISGVAGTSTLTIATALWLMFVLPFIAIQLLKLRKYLRKKRGKPL